MDIYLLLAYGRCPCPCHIAASSRLRLPINIVTGDCLLFCRTMTINHPSIVNNNVGCLPACSSSMMINWTRPVTVPWLIMKRWRWWLRSWCTDLPAKRMVTIGDDEEERINQCNKWQIEQRELGRGDWFSKILETQFDRYQLSTSSFVVAFLNSSPSTECRRFRITNLTAPVQRW